MRFRGFEVGHLPDAVGAADLLAALAMPGFGTVADALPDGLMALDATGLVTLANKAAQSIHDLTRERLLGATVAELAETQHARLHRACRSLRGRSPRRSLRHDSRRTRHPGLRAADARPSARHHADARSCCATSTCSTISATPDARRRGPSSFRFRAVPRRPPRRSDGDLPSRRRWNVRSAMATARWSGARACSSPANRALARPRSPSTCTRRLRRRTGPSSTSTAAAFPESLFESEMFGYERGSVHRRPAGRPKGLIENAGGGTLFLDEVGEIPLIEPGEAAEIPGGRHGPADRRGVPASGSTCASSPPPTATLDLMVRTGPVPPRSLPPLDVSRSTCRRCAMRRELIEALLDLYWNGRMRGRTPPLDLARDAASTCSAHDFPGNMRELANIVEHLSVVADGEQARPTCRPRSRSAPHRPSSAGPVPNRPTDCRTFR